MNCGNIEGSKSHSRLVFTMTRKGEVALLQKGNEAKAIGINFCIFVLCNSRAQKSFT